MEVTLLEVGRVARPHGLRGEVVVQLLTDRAERLAPGSVLTTTPGFRSVEVVRSSPHGGPGRAVPGQSDPGRAVPGQQSGPGGAVPGQQSGPGSAVPARGGRWIVAFAGVEDRDGAEALRDVVLLARPLDDPEALWVHELIGSDVVDVAGRPLGVVVEVEANPASDLLVLDAGGLVPLRFVVDHGPGRVVVDPPAGLLD